MAITVQRGPSMANYGYAVARAAEQAANADRAHQHATYLAGIQQANQTYNLGLGSLALNQQKTALDITSEANKTALAARSLDQADVTSALNRDRLLAEIEQAKHGNQLAAQSQASQSLNSYAALMRALG
jgi:hypothetical protein